MIRIVKPLVYTPLFDAEQLDLHVMRLERYPENAIDFFVKVKITKSKYKSTINDPVERMQYNFIEDYDHMIDEFKKQRGIKDKHIKSIKQIDEDDIYNRPFYKIDYEAK